MFDYTCLLLTLRHSAGNRVDINLSQNNLKDNRDKKIAVDSMEGAGGGGGKTSSVTVPLANNAEDDMSDTGAC